MTTKQLQSRNSARVSETIIRPPRGTFSLDLTELYRYRHLIAALVWRNVRTENDALHLTFLWIVLRPLVYVAIFASFRRLSDANTFVEIAYPLYIYTGFALWYYVLDATASSSTALQRDAALVSKVYFPRIISPIVPAIAGLSNLAISLVPLIGLMAIFGARPDWHLVLLPLVLLQCAALTVGVGSFVAAISLEHRDWERALQFILFVGLFVSPVIYAPEMIPASIRTIYLLNPMAGSLLAFRATLFADFPFPLAQWLYSCAFSGIALGAGLWVFQKAEATIAETL